MKPGKMKVPEKSLYVKADFSDRTKSQHIMAARSGLRKMTTSADLTKMIVAVLPGQLQYTSNGGASWTPLSSPTAQWSCIAASSDFIKIIASVEGGALYKSGDAVARWTALGGGVETNMNWRGIAASGDFRRLSAVISGG